MKSFLFEVKAFINIHLSIEDLTLKHFIDFLPMNCLICIESLSDQKVISLQFIYPTFIYFF